MELFISEPYPEPWKQDPALIAAAAVESEAEQEYAIATTAWLNTIRALAEHRLTAVLHPRHGWINPDDQDTTISNRRKRTLADAENTARERRETASHTHRGASRPQRSADHSARHTPDPGTRS